MAVKMISEADVYLWRNQLTVFCSLNIALNSAILSQMAWLCFFLICSTIVPNSFAATENRTHGRVAPPWRTLGTLRDLFVRRSIDWATRPRPVIKLKWLIKYKLTPRVIFSGWGSALKAKNRLWLKTPLGLGYANGWSNTNTSVL